MLTIASIILAMIAADADSTFKDRAEGLSPTVFVTDSSFTKPTERASRMVLPSTDLPELAWGVLKQARRPDDILMESQFFQYQTTTTDLSDVGF